MPLLLVTYQPSSVPKERISCFLPLTGISLYEQESIEHCWVIEGYS